MQELLTIDASYRDNIAQIIAKLDKKQADYHVSFIIDAKKNTLQLIGGHAPEYVHITIPLAEEHLLKKRRFTLDGAFFSQLLTYSQHEQSIHLNLDTDNSSLPEVGITAGEQKWRSCESDSFCEQHDKYIKKIKEQVYEKVRVADTQRLFLEVDTHSPFQYIDINKDKKEMCVQSDNNQQVFAIPDNIPVALSVGLTQEAAKSLKELCEETQDDTIDIAIHDESITFRTNGIDTTISLAGIDEFYKNKPKEFDEVVSMTVDIFRFKAEIEEYYKKYPIIRRANQSYLLIEPDQLYIANTVGKYRFGSPVKAKRITTKESQLYLIHLRDIEAIRVKDLTTARELHIAILKGAEAEEEYKLGFYKQGNMNYPYASVAVEPAPQAMESVLAVKNKEEKSKACQQSEEPEEQEELQRDLCLEDI